MSETDAFDWSIFKRTIHSARSTTGYFWFFKAMNLINGAGLIFPFYQGAYILNQENCNKEEKEQRGMNEQAQMDA